MTGGPAPEEELLEGPSGSIGRNGPDRVSVALLAAAAALFCLTWAPVAAGLFEQWLEDPNYRHGLLIPVLSGLILWKRRERLKSAVNGKHHLAGLVLIILSAVLLVGGTAASELFTSRLSMPVFIIGAVLLLGGSELAASAAFPLLYLLLAIPLPYIIYYKLTFPLQILSARLSAGVLDLLRVSVIRKGNILSLPNYTLEVIAACSGLRSLMTMFALSLILAWLTDMSPARRAALTVCAVPVAIAANTIRLTVTAIGAYAVSPAVADGVLHDISGLIVFLSGLTMLLACRLVLKWTER